MRKEKPLKNKQTQNSTVPYGKGFSYKGAVNVLSKKIAQLPLRASAKLSKQLSARHRGDRSLALGEKSQHKVKRNTEGRRNPQNFL